MPMHTEKTKRRHNKPKNPGRLIRPHGLTTKNYPFLQIFIPINMDSIHWYLCVINIRKLYVQVLDSLGTAMHRKDLTATVSS